MIKILHTADTHNQMTKEKADYLKSLEPNLIFDSGDIIKSGNVDFNPRGEKAWDIYNGVYDAICPGNREYHFSKWGFYCKIKGFQMPLLACNYVFKLQITNSIPSSVSNETATPQAYGLGGQKVPVVPYLYFDVDNIKICVIGVSNINIDESMFCHRFASQYQKDIFESVSETIKNMDCDLLIALTHIGLEKDRQLAEKFPQINLILGGHSHDYLNEKVGGTVIVHSGAFAEHFSEIIIENKEISVNQIDF
ncbi:MAG: metallophosphoesterase [Abditibacteriota bacterium]|nr:metallophosphoesterase [Abditibacteriota bacterium]